MKAIETLHDFYDVMMSTVSVRKGLVKSYLNTGGVGADALAPLHEALASLRAICTQGTAAAVALDAERQITLDITYEINELVKDIFFLEHDEPAFDAYLGDLHQDFETQVTAGVEVLRDVSIKALLTDRDGTVNNYCGRYASSVQSVYNAVFLTRFARLATESAVILTSAPLDNIGLADIAVSPPNVFTFAGSKGREYFNTHGERRVFPIARAKQDKLDALNAELSALLQQPEYEIYGLIGSGLQFKFGQTTVARQDITGSIPQGRSEGFLSTLRAIVAELDPEGAFFRIEDTGLDVEIILTVESGGGGEGTKDFDKGDGIRFLDNDIGLGMSEGLCLICGDTGSDVPMVTTSMDIARETYAVFVTRKEDLRAKVRATCPHALFVTEPDMLVMMLNRLAKLRGTG